VRSGVAPDHPEVKSVQNDFESVASDPRVSFLGNVAVGRDISVSDLQKHYNAVVLAYGAASDKYLNIEGERLRNVCSARAFVNWYNGHPDFTTFHPNLDSEDVVVIGQGNVALDCARILCKTVHELRATDIAANALQLLASSKVKRVHVLGRRGHIQAAFTMKELRELTRLSDVDVIISKEELQLGRNPASLQELQLHRSKSRMDALLADMTNVPTGVKSKQLFLRFFLSPITVLPSADDPSAVGSVLCQRTELIGPPEHQTAVAVQQTEAIPAGMVLRSIGYKSVSVPGVPFDDKRAVVRNEAGRVMHPDGSKVPGLYVSGWLKRGPSGIIGTNIPDARETVACISQDRLAKALPALQVSTADAGLNGVRRVLMEAGRQPTELISWQDFQRINAAELKRGQLSGKPREKYTDINEMLKVLRENNTRST
jgi:adrenodoxin-NADP+ reductase